MACTLRKPELFEPLPPRAGAGRIQRLQDLVCTGPWSNRDDLVLLYWQPAGGGRWVAWVDSPPKVDPLPEANVSIAP
jgi:hypothetical protein